MEGYNFLFDGTHLLKVSHIFSEQYDAHNAITDVAALRGLVEIIDVCHEAVESSIFSANTVKNMMVFDAQKSRNYETLKELMTSGLLTKCMG